MGDIARIMPRISATLENRQVDHQTSMVEIEGMLRDKAISILIDLGASLSYVSLRIVEIYKLQQYNFEKYWLVQLDVGTKQKVNRFMKMCDFIMNCLKTRFDINMLPQDLIICC